MFLNPIIFSNLNFNCSNSLDLKSLQKQVKKHSVTKNCSDLSLFESIVLVITKFCKFLAFSLQFQKFFSIFLTVGQNNFGNKIPNDILKKKERKKTNIKDHKGKFFCEHCSFVFFLDRIIDFAK